jgi:hypothetical protein
MAACVRLLTLPFKQSNKLVAHINEGHFLAASSQRKLKHLAIERERFLDTTDFQGYVIDADDSCLVAHFDASIFHGDTAGK